MKNLKIGTIMTVATGIGLWILICLYYKTDINNFTDSLKHIYKAATFTFVLRYIFIKWLWKLPLLDKIHKVPNLSGSWSGTFKSTWKSAEDQKEATGDINIKIYQPDIHTIKITQYSKESISCSYGETFEWKCNGELEVRYSYLNEPNADVRERSQISYGSTKLTYDSDKKALAGNYWTDRKSTGYMQIQKK